MSPVMRELVKTPIDILNSYYITGGESFKKQGHCEPPHTQPPLQQVQLTL